MIIQKTGPHLPPQVEANMVTHTAKMKVKMIVQTPQRLSFEKRRSDAPKLIGRQGRRLRRPRQHAWLRVVEAKK